MRIRIYDDGDRQASPTSTRARTGSRTAGFEAFRFQWSPDSRWLAYARPAATEQQRDLPLRHEGRQAAAGDERISERHAADVRSRRQVSLLRVRSRVRSGLRQLRQLVDVSESDAAGRRAAAYATSSRRWPRATTPRTSALDTDKPTRRSPTTKPGRAAGNGPPAARQRRHRSRWLRGARRRAAAEGRQLRRSAGHQGQAALSPSAAHRLRRREEPHRLLRFRGARREDRARRRRRRSRRPPTARRCSSTQQEEVRDRRDQGGAEVRETDGPADIEAPVDPRAEWRQIFIDAYRFERDFFYDPNMHGVDWDAMRERYASCWTTR